MQTTYLELVEGVGVEASHVNEPTTGLEIPNPKAGEPAPLRSIGIQIPVPTKLGDDVIDTTFKAYIQPADQLDPSNPIQARIIPGTRIVETTAPAVVNLLIETGHYQQCDPPAEKEAEKPTKSRRHADTPKED